jgi:hypothetical protein
LPSISVLFADGDSTEIEATSKTPFVLYQGTTSVVPQFAPGRIGLQPLRIPDLKQLCLCVLRPLHGEKEKARFPILIPDL